MSWVLFAILSAALYAVTNFIDKYILESEVRDYRSLSMYSGLVSFVFGCLYWVFVGFPLLPARDTVLIILTGVLTIWGLALYFRALSSEATSTVIILFQLTPVMTLLLSAIILGEKISIAQAFGFFLIMIAGIGVALKREHLHTYVSTALLFVLLADVLWASSAILFKLVASSAVFTQLIPYESWGIALGSMILYLQFLSVRNAFHQINKSLRKIIIGTIFINEIIFVIAKLLGFYAITIGPVALVSVVGSTQVFFGVVYGLFLTFLAPSVFKEDISSLGLIKKLFLAFMIFMGIWLIQ